MVTKALKRKEVELGFVHIPAKNRAELLGEAVAPFETKLNDLPAKVDKYGRIWSDCLRQKFPVDTKISITKDSEGLRIAALGQVSIAPEYVQPTPTSLETGRQTVNRANLIDQLKHEVSEKPVENKAVAADSKPYFRSDAIYVFNDDILKTTAIRDDTVDLIVTSPPYCVAIKYENYDDGIPYNEYLSFSKKWLQKCHELSKKDGRLCLNIPLDKNKGGQQSVYADLTRIAKDVGWKYQSTIIWNEQNMSRRTAWGSWLSASAPFVIAPVEVIVVLYKERWGKLERGKSDINKRDFIDWTNGVWNFSGESKRRIGHPAPFPVELPKRCIKLFSYVGDVVLDPFLGSGTTLLACLETNRAGIGIEVNKNYCDLAEKRLQKGIAQKNL
jgi:site-specific DNA-methyltransferase (adenine-specific)